MACPSTSRIRLWRSRDLIRKTLLALTSTSAMSTPSSFGRKKPSRTTLPLAQPESWTIISLFAVRKFSHPEEDNVSDSDEGVEAKQKQRRSERLRSRARLPTPAIDPQLPRFWVEVPPLRREQVEEFSSLRVVGEAEETWD